MVMNNLARRIVVQGPLVIQYRKWILWGQLSPYGGKFHKFNLIHKLGRSGMDSLDRNNICIGSILGLNFDFSGGQGKVENP